MKQSLKVQNIKERPFQVSNTPMICSFVKRLLNSRKTYRMTYRHWNLLILSSLVGFSQLSTSVRLLRRLVFFTVYSTKMKSQFRPFSKVW